MADTILDDLKRIKSIFDAMPLSKISWQSASQTEFEHEFKTPLLRLACFLLLSKMPDEGISELYETLIEMREFYDTRIQEDKPLLLSQPQKVQATIGKSIVRPEFSIESEV